MARTYTLRKLEGNDELEEFHEENESLVLEQDTKLFRKYFYRKKHKETIERAVENHSIIETIEYYTSTPVYYFQENRTLIVKSGRGYSDIIYNHLKRNLGLTLMALEFRFVKFFEALEKNWNIEVDPISIEIIGYIKNEDLFGNLFATISNKEVFRDLLKTHQLGVKSVRFGTSNGFESDFQSDFTFKMFGGSRDDQDFFEFINDFLKNGGF